MNMATQHCLVGSHAYAIGRSYGRVRTDDIFGVACLSHIANDLCARYPNVGFRASPEIDAEWTSIDSDTGYCDDEDEPIAVINGDGLVAPLRKPYVVTDTSPWTAVLIALAASSLLFALWWFS